VAALMAERRDGLDPTRDTSRAARQREFARRRSAQVNTTA